MSASEYCISFIKDVEGFSAKPYYDYSQYTVGYGTECPDDKYSEYMASGISKQEADRLLREHVEQIDETLNEKLIDAYDLSFQQHEYDALVSFSYNIGTGWVTYDSTLRNSILRNADDEDMVYAFGLYCTAGGKYLPALITRRLCEANMFLNAVYSKHISDAYGYVYYDANGGTLTYRVQGFLCDNATVPVANAVRDGDVFLGWYTDLTGGSQVNVLTGELTGKTLFAHWQSSENPDNLDSTSVTVKVTGDVVNVRSGPGTNYGVVKQIRQNEVLTVSHVTYLTNMKWGKIQSGWICLDYTNYDDVVSGSSSKDDNASETVTSPGGQADRPASKPSSGTQKTVPGIVNVNDFLKVRSGPGTSHSIVGFLFKNNRVQILEQKTVGSTTWGRIKDGWVCMDYIITDQDQMNDASESEKQEDSTGNMPSGAGSNYESVSIRGKITADKLRIRSAPGTDSTIVGFCYQNEAVLISQRVLVGSAYWGKTSKGWISMDYVLIESSGAVSQRPAESKTKTVIADCLRIRKDAGTNHKIVGFLYDGDKVTVLETKNVSGTVWGRVDKGWICMEYVR